MIKVFPVTQANLEQHADAKKFFSGIPGYKRTAYTPPEPPAGNSIYATKSEAILDGLIAYLPVTETSGDTTYDVIANYNIAWQGQSISNDAPHINFKSRYHPFSTTPAGIITADASWATEFSEYTIYFWIKIPDYTTATRYITCNNINGASSYHWHLFLYGGKLTFASAIPSVSGYMGPNTSYTANTWINIILRKNATNITIIVSDNNFSQTDRKSVV